MTTKSKISFFGWRKNLQISEQDPSYKVRYLGNVQTAMMKGEGCVDKPINTIWNNYMRSPHPGLEMKLVLTGSGLKAYTKEQGLTEYRAHRISYCIAHPSYPKLFVWVYRHEGKKMKMELRCHAVLCKSEAKAKAIALQLHEKLSFALKEFQREKLRKQNSRLTLQRTNSLPKQGSVLPLRKQLLSTANNFKPPASKSTGAPKLGAIHEDHEEEEEEMRRSLAEVLEEEEEDDSFNEGIDLDSAGFRPAAMLEALNLESPEAMGEDFISEPIIDVECGNDIEQLRCDRDVQYCVHEAADSDEESAESGFHDQDERAQAAVEEDVDADEVEVVLNPIGDEADRPL
ncbi:protein FAM43A-like [Littorina saxatilis]|uniref:PID domain-containing protein n=1 Tax=Littorina saxatilis TaxID=31220 RepID=A0AAN9APE6_9CAEN